MNAGDDSDGVGDDSKNAITANNAARTKWYLPRPVVLVTTHHYVGTFELTRVTLDLLW